MIRKKAGLLALSLFAAALTGSARADFVYGGQAYGALSPGIVDPPIAATPALPPGGGSVSAHLNSFSFMGVVTSGALDAKAMGANGLTSADASIATFHADLRPLNINFVANADLIAAHSEANGSANPLSVAGSATFTNLVVNGMAVPAQVPTNTKVDLGAAGFIMLNEETSAATATDGQIAVNAIHVHLSGGIEIFLAHTESSISNQQAVVPEPGTLLLLGVGILGVLGFRKIAGRPSCRFRPPHPRRRSGGGRLAFLFQETTF